MSFVSTYLKFSSKSYSLGIVTLCKSYSLLRIQPGLWTPDPALWALINACGWGEVTGALASLQERVHIACHLPRSQGMGLMSWHGNHPLELSCICPLGESTMFSLYFLYQWGMKINNGKSQYHLRSITGRIVDLRNPQQERIINYRPQEEKMYIASLIRNWLPQQLSQWEAVIILNSSFPPMAFIQNNHCQLPPLSP